MTKKYLLPLILLLGLAIVLVLLPQKNTYDEMQPAELLRQVSATSRFISPENVADRIIKKDPSLYLIDVRNKEDYKDFQLPGAINIPLEDLMKPDQVQILTQEGIEFVFYSNGDILADQAWILCKRKGLKNIFVMEGGLNEWFKKFFLIQPLPETASSSEIEDFQFRIGVRQYLTGGENISPVNSSVETINVAPRAKKTTVEGGC